MLIFSVHLKGTKESDIGCALVKREGERVDQQISSKDCWFDNESSLLQNKFPQSILQVQVLCDWKDAQAGTYFIYLKLGANFEATFEITLCHGGPSSYFTSSHRVQIFISHHIHHHNKQSWISVSAALLKAQAKYSFYSKWI